MNSVTLDDFLKNNGIYKNTGLTMKDYFMLNTECRNSFNLNIKQKFNVKICVDYNGLISFLSN